ncbi:MAG: DUF1289 domain-containing protein [Gammaproteobacteria bacterium]
MQTDGPPDISSPCVRICCLDEQEICLGCFRHIEEITGWSAADDTERLAILERCERRRTARTGQSP